MSLNDTVIGLPSETASGVVSDDLLVALRFEGLMIPANASVVSAEIQFRSFAPDSNPGSPALQLAASKSGHVTSFSSFVVSQLSLVGSVVWYPEVWLDANVAGGAQRAVGLESIFQQLVSLQSWNASSGVVTIVIKRKEPVPLNDPTNPPPFRLASFGPQTAPILTISYQGWS